MSNSMSVVSPTYAGQPIQFGNGAVGPEFSLTNGGASHIAQAINSQRIGVQITPYGTVSADCTLQLKLSLDGVNYRTTKTFTNAECVAGAYATLDVKAKYYQFLFIPGTTAAGSGVKVKVMD